FLRRALFGEARAHSVERVGELVLVDRLHQVVDRVGLERPDCVLLVGRDEHEQRRLDLHHALDHRKPVEAGHLDVEEHEVGLLGLDRADGLAAVGARADDLDVGIGLEPQLQALDGKFLVVDEQGTNGHAWVPTARSPGSLVTAVAAGGFAEASVGGSGSRKTSYGTSMMTVNPPSGGVTMSKRWSSP